MQLPSEEALFSGGELGILLPVNTVDEIQQLGALAAGLAEIALSGRHIFVIIAQWIIKCNVRQGNRAKEKFPLAAFCMMQKAARGNFSSLRSQ